MILPFLAMLQTPFDHLVDAPHPLSYACQRGTPKIDGKLDEAAWENAPWTSDFVDIEGSLKAAPRFKTRAKMLWDDDYFYIAAAMEEPHVWATLTKHDSVIFHDNDFEVFIDPDGDNHNYYEFEINALNTGWDLKLPKPYRDGGPAQNEWELPGLRTAIHIDGTINNPADKDRGWTVEIAMPWGALGGLPQAGGHWRVNFSRVEWQFDIVEGKYVKRPGMREDNWVWTPQWVIDMHQPQMWGYVRFENASEMPRLDPTHRARMLLHHIYYRQKAFREKNGSFASKLTDLEIVVPDGIFLRPPRIHVRRSGFEASGVVQAGGGPVVLSIREDSLIRVLESLP
ncbi:MAG: carbohydrate-binding family 9-like protein [Armatimonadota bacterium]|nr:carbohydrate-binding family 9-like protein [Armatimonadota bacterium]